MKEVKKLIDLGKERGYVTYDDINRMVPSDDVLPEDLQHLLVRDRRDVVDADVVVGDERDVREAEFRLACQRHLRELRHTDHVAADLREHLRFGAGREARTFDHDHRAAVAMLDTQLARL